MHIEQLADLAFDPAARAVAARRIPCAVLGIVDRAGARAVRWAGAAQLAPEARPVARDTWFDLASLTKVLFTTDRILALAASGAIELDAPLTTLVPDLRQYDMAAAERRITFRQCLGHQTHLPAVEPIYTYGADPATLRAFVLQRAWQPGPPVYSDINFILLGIALERLAGLTIGEMEAGPGLSFRPHYALCAATEACAWRGRIMVGEVHDENAYALGGAGHAGLFGTVDGVLDHAATVLNGAGLERVRVAGDRAHGWELRRPGWPGGDACSHETIGHTGFTGTGVWVDVRAGLAWTLLTNRVHPSRHMETGIAALRRKTGELVVRGASRPME